MSLGGSTPHPSEVRLLTRAVDAPHMITCPTYPPMTGMSAFHWFS